MNIHLFTECYEVVFVSHRKQSYSSLLKQKREQRKYYSKLLCVFNSIMYVNNINVKSHLDHRHRVRETSPVGQRPSTLPLPLHPHPPPSTPSQPHNLRSPVSVTSTTTPAITSSSVPAAAVETVPSFLPGSHEPPHNMFSPTRFYSTVNDTPGTVAFNGEISESRTELNSGGENTIATEAPIATPLPPSPKQRVEKQQSGARKSGKKTKRKKGSRRDHRKVASSRSEVQQQGERETPVENVVTSDENASLSEPMDTSATLNYSSSSDLRVSIGQSVSPHLNSVSVSQHIGQVSENGPVSTTTDTTSETMSHSNGAGRSMMMVKVKEEPVTNHEEELQQSYKASSKVSVCVFSG